MKADWNRPFKRPPHDWSQDGGCNFVDYKTRYREGLDLVLRGITCHVKGGEKVFTKIHCNNFNIIKKIIFVRKMLYVSSNHIPVF